MGQAGGAPGAGGLEWYRGAVAGWEAVAPQLARAVAMAGASGSGKEEAARVARAAARARRDCERLDEALGALACAAGPEAHAAALEDSSAAARALCGSIGKAHAAASEGARALGGTANSELFSAMAAMAMAAADAQAVCEVCAGRRRALKR